jgi:hypothetical protein
MEHPPKESGGSGSERFSEENDQEEPEECPYEEMDLSGIISIAEQIRAELEEFKPNLPLIVGLRNPGMRDRHWDVITELVRGKTADGDLIIHPESDTFKLDQFLAWGMKELI